MTNALVGHAVQLLLGVNSTMNSRLVSNRSTEAPMDFEFTSRSTANMKPVWATGAHDDPQTPRKRTQPTRLPHKFSCNYLQEL